MANFETHLSIGTLSSGFLASLTLSLGILPKEDLIPLTITGIIGSILPDIDLKESRPSKALFSSLGFFFSFVVLFSCTKKYSIAELWLLWLGTLVFIRYGAQLFFHNITTHRGICHSLLAATFSSLLSTEFFYFVLGYQEIVAWTAALFLFTGYSIHLVLDEIYSVDFVGAYTKKSFGTALKIYDTHNLFASSFIFCGIMLLYTYAPSNETFLKQFFSPGAWAHLGENFMPQGKWFGLVDPHT